MFKSFKIGKYQYDEEEFNKLESTIIERVTKIEVYTKNEARKICRLILMSKIRMAQLSHCNLEIKYTCTNNKLTKDQINSINLELSNIQGVNANAIIREAKGEITKTLVFKIKEKIAALERILEKINMESYCYKLVIKLLDIDNMNMLSMVMKKLEYFVSDLYDVIKDIYCSKSLRLS